MASAKRVIFVLALLGMIAIANKTEARTKYDRSMMVYDGMGYTGDDLDLLARLVYAECGSDWCSDQMQQYTASVVLNRVKSDLYPNTIHDVIYQEGQYYCVESGGIVLQCNARAIQNARTILESGSIIPDDVLYQAEFQQGRGIYEVIGGMYFCYGGEQSDGH